MKRIIAIVALLMCGIMGVALGEGVETVSFGSYPQTNETSEPIAWRVLAEQDGRALLLAENALASLPWHNAREAVTWDHSDLRAWLNDEFLQTAFSEEEQASILPVTLDNGDVLGYGTPAGEDTQDSVFLLAGDEVLEYLPTDEQRTVAPTAYAIAQGAYTNGEGNCAWWLRSPGMTETSPAYLSSGGVVGNRAHEVDETIIGVRPAILVDVSTLSKNTPTEAKALYDWAHGLEDEALDDLTDTPLTATGVVTYVGKDIHGLPSFRLSDSADGDCYVHACLASEAEYGDVQVGDTVTVTGNFHVLSDEWGVVLKNSAGK